MTDSNLSQLLERNMTQLTGKSALAVNLPLSCLTLLQSCQSIAKLTSLHFHYGEYQQSQSLAQVESVFTASYQANTQHDLLIVRFPKSKAEFQFTLTMLQSAAPNASVMIIGENKSGIKSINKLAENLLTNIIKQDNARHCLLYSAQLLPSVKPFKLDDWFHYFDVNVNDTPIKLAALPGVFSQKRLDKGTELLLTQLPSNISGKGLDFGCGCGVISCYILARNPQTQLTCLDVNALALASTEKSLALNGFHGTLLANDSIKSITANFDFVVSNPPFHQGIKTNYAATEYFLKEIAHHISSNGELFIVANQFLQYQAIMQTAFGNCSKVQQQHGFSIYHCKKS